MTTALDAGIVAARDARRQEAADSLMIAARERALENALDAVAKIADADGVLPRDSVTRLLSELEAECRGKALMLVTALRLAGVPDDEPLAVELLKRALL